MKIKTNKLIFLAALALAPIQSQAALIAHYTFDEASGTTAADSVRGTAGDATLNNGATFSAGKIGYALTLDGANDWASALNPVVNGQPQLTVAAWVNIDTLTSWGTILKDWESTHTFHFGLDNNTANISNYIGGSGAGPVVSTAITLDTWYHVAFTFDDAANTQKIYLNGVLAGTTTATSGTLATGGGTMGIGGSTQPHQFLDGQIDDLAMWDEVLTDQKIAQIYQNGINGVAVPEPSAALLGGLGVLALLRRRRN